MAKIVLDSSLLTHEKTLRLMASQKMSLYEAVGSLACLWLWCSERRPDGNLKEMNDDMIRMVAGCPANQIGFVHSLVESGFLERKDGSLFVHDWHEWMSDETYNRARYQKRKVGGKSGGNSTVLANAAESLSLSLPVSKGTTETKTTTKAVSVEKPKAVHVEFVDRFKGFYEAVVKKPFKYGRAQFVIADKLIKAHGNEMVVEKAKILAVMCRRKSTWFTKAGWADFSIEKLSSQWNGILEESVLPNEVEEAEEIRRKWRDHNELVTRIMATR